MATLYLLEGSSPENQHCQKKSVRLDMLMNRFYPFKPVYFRETFSVPGEQYPPRPLNAVYLEIESSEVDGFLFEKMGVYILQDQSPKIIDIDSL